MIPITTAIKKILADADYTHCDKCEFKDACSKDELYCLPAILGILENEKWEVKK